MLSGQQSTFDSLHRRTADELSATGRLVSRHAQQLDLRDLINSRMRHGTYVDPRRLEAWAELSESCRQRSGEAPNGTWVPLSLLTRGLSTSDTALVAPQTAKNAAASLLPQSAVVGGGATVISGLQGSTFGIPTVDPSLDAGDGWVAEGDTAAVREPSFKTAVVTPHTLSVQMSVSRQLLQNTAVDLNALLLRELNARLSYAIDAAAINGTGNGQPLGLLRHAELDVAAAGPNGAAPTYAHLVELEHRVLSRAGGDTQAPSFLMSPKLAKKLRTTQRVSGGDRFIYEGADLLGYAVRTAPNVPDDLSKGTANGNCSALLFGDIAEMVVGFWGPAAVDLLIDDYTYSPSGKVRIIARAEVGIAPRRIGAFAAYKDLLTA